LAELGEWPAYYGHMASLNSAGPARPDLSPPPEATPEEIRRRIEAGEWVVDLRDRTAFAAGHVPGSLNFGLDGSFATHLGWLTDWAPPLTRLGERPEDVTQAQRELVRIGIDRPVAAATGGPERWSDREPASFGQADFRRLAEVLRGHQAEVPAGRRVVVLDVRRPEEFAAGHIEGAVNVPLHRLRSAELPPGEVWVHCQSGYRASVAASLLAAAGRDVVAIDDHFREAAAAGLTVTTSAAAAGLTVTAGEGGAGSRPPASGPA